MIDGPTAAVIAAAVIGTFGTIIVAIVKLVPQRFDHPERIDRPGDRIGAVESRMSVAEANHANLATWMIEQKHEFTELRGDIHALTIAVESLKNRIA